MEATKIMKTDSRFALQEDDFITLPKIQLESDFWSFNKGDKVWIQFIKEKLTFTGIVIGFNNSPQCGRLIYVRTSAITFIWLDYFSEEFIISYQQNQKHEEVRAVKGFKFDSLEEATSDVNHDFCIVCGKSKTDEDDFCETCANEGWWMDPMGTIHASDDDPLLAYE